MKKVVVEFFERPQLLGYIDLQSLSDPQQLEILEPNGVLQALPVQQVKLVSFVRDFDSSQNSGTERRLFSSRPRTSGLWIRMRFRDGEVMDGILPHNLLELPPFGFVVSIPNPNSRRQQIYVPKSSLIEAVTVAVVGSPLAPARRRKEKAEQLGLFAEDTRKGN